ncbi:type II toxin-antitoxin system RelE/ParE family toxin [Hellea sp.]|nr:type II toxin-antitoxin system RelE/ParE family toxin [Hellea sp.]
MNITSIKHKGLKRFVETGQTRGLPSQYAEKIGVLVEALIAIPNIAAFLSLPKGKPHRLKGDRHVDYAINISRNWRMTFRHNDKDNTIEILDLEDYH